MSTALTLSPEPRNRALGNTILRWTPRVAVSAWAGFWAWFVLAVGISDVRDGLVGAVPIVGAWLAALGALTASIWIWPRAGGALMIGSGIGAAVFFDNPWARVLLALPAVLVGLVSLLSPQAGRIPR